LPNFQPKDKAARQSARVQESSPDVVKAYVKELLLAASIQHVVRESHSLLSELEQYQNDRWAVVIRRQAQARQLARGGSKDKGAKPPKGKRPSSHAVGVNRRVVGTPLSAATPPPDMSASDTPFSVLVGQSVAVGETSRPPVKKLNKKKRAGSAESIHDEGEFSFPFVDPYSLSQTNTQLHQRVLEMAWLQSETVKQERRQGRKDGLGLPGSLRPDRKFERLMNSAGMTVQGKPLSSNREGSSNTSVSGAGAVLAGLSMLGDDDRTSPRTTSSVGKRVQSLKI